MSPAQFLHCNSLEAWRVPTKLSIDRSTWRASQLPHIESILYRLVQFFDFSGVTGAHQPFQALARNSEYVVEVRDTWRRQSLPASEDYFGRKLTDRARNKRDNDATNTFKNSIPG
jgi:hypothetical protein